MYAAWLSRTKVSLFLLTGITNNGKFQINPILIVRILQFVDDSLLEKIILVLKTHFARVKEVTVCCNPLANIISIELAANS